MEFFKIVKVKTSEESIQEHVTLSALENFSNEIFPLDEPTSDLVEIGGIWGSLLDSHHRVPTGTQFHSHSFDYQPYTQTP